jgi:ankyrin repeat protein
MAFRRFLLIAAMACGLASSPAAAQFGTDSERFIGAVKGRNVTEAVDLLRVRPNVINAKDYNGDTALTISVTRRDDEWTSFLLSQGADPNAAGRNGDTPLIIATRLGDGGAATRLLARNAKVDGANKKGETPLIMAVQLRNLGLVRLLLTAGADPDKTDSVAGYSARDYAKRDGRAREILRLIESGKPKS